MFLWKQEASKSLLGTPVGKVASWNSLGIHFISAANPFVHSVNSHSTYAASTNNTHEVTITW